MRLPEAARQSGLRPSWVGYVGVDDVAAAAERIERLGGAVYVPPTDVPNISRFSLAADWEQAFALPRALRLAKSADRHRRGGHVSAVLRERGDDRRHVHQACDGAGPVLALLLQRRRYRRRDKAGEGRRRDDPRGSD